MSCHPRHPSCASAPTTEPGFSCAARLSGGSALGDGAIAVTIEPACQADLRPLLMRAHKLSAREREVAALAAKGLTNVELASALFITRHTVADHLKAIYDKLGVNSRGELTSVLGGFR
ncbi:helix-turn-helix transcriptional regulator [Amycolatopsis sp. NPDC047767]|uniref:helix-turn-helix transcriptional regulator n=1 Tax=Amycolatopsis sp. NPDC047767 TaxID=3156765 RepID=UPI0034534A51